MASYRPNKQVYDFIRKKWLMATPEEIVRQKLLRFMVENLGYPKNAFAIEKTLSEVVQNSRVPNRRLDILCFEIRHVRPLLLIECKATPIHKDMFTQLTGYNMYVGAPLICLANQNATFLKWKNQEVIQKGIPIYAELAHVFI